MRPKKYQRARLAQFVIASAFIVSLLALAVPLTGVSSPSLIDLRLFGGAGDQRAVKPTFSGGQVYVAENAAPSTGMVGQFAPAPGLPQAWGTALGGTTSLAGIAPNPAGGVFAVGACVPPACGAQDFVGGTEAKIGISSFNAAGNLVFSKSANIFAYRGTEALAAATSIIEGGATVVYAVGFGEPCSNALNIFVKFDANGNLLAKATEPGLEPNFNVTCAAAPFGSAVADDVVAAAGGVYVAGASASRPGDTDNVLRPVILRYDTNLNRQWKQRYPDVAGQLLAITEAGGALYAAGYANAGGSQQYLIQKYDLNGNRLWSQISGGTGTDIFYGIIVVDGRLFAVGKSNSPGMDAFDGIITEFDPATGNPLAGNAFGGPLDQSLNGVTTDGTDLFVAGETRLAGGNEAALLRYSLSGPSATTTIVTASPNPSVYGQTVTFTATVTSGATAVTQGSVTFKEGALIVSGPTNLDASGQATLNASSLSAGPHIITAEYSGDPAFAASSGSTTQTINKASTSTTVSSSANPSVIGQGLTLTATVTAVPPGAGTPAGQVQFRAGGMNLGFAVPLVNGVASIQTSQLGIGSHSITADFSGDSGFNASTGDLLQAVNKGASQTTVTSSPNPSTYGQGITFTATVTAMPPAAGVPTGSVQFKDNGAPFGGPTPVNLGVATSFPFVLGVGPHTITAEFSGDFSFNPSSGSANHLVNKVDTTTMLTSSPNPSTVTNSIFFSVHVSQPAGSVNEGTVTLKTGAVVVAGPFGLDGVGNANFSVSTLPPGSHAITAEYSGSNNFNPSSSAALMQTVNALTPFININTNTFTYDGNPHPATATVSGQNGAPINGTLSFSYSPGGASEPVNAGTYGVTATFTSNDPNYANAVASVGPTPGGGTWSNRASMPTGRYGPPSAVINNKIYVAAGCCLGGITRYNSLEVFDQSNNSWTSKAPIPIGVYGAGAAAINGIFYVAAGQEANGNINNMQAYNPATDTWSSKTAMPDASSGVGAAVVNNQMYVIGGMDPSNNFVVNHVRRYDPVSNSWTARAPMPTAREFMGVASQNNRIYVVGGYANGTPLSKLEVYDPNSNSWSTKAPMPTARYGLTVEFLNGTLYAIGGNGAAAGLYQPLATVEAYDPNTDTWTTLAPAPNTHYLAGGGQVFGTLYLVGGVDAAGAHTTRNVAFTPDRLLRINKRQPQLSVTGGIFPYDTLRHPASATATGIGGVAVPGTFAFNYSPGGSLAPLTPGFYGVNATFTSADPNYQSGGSTFGNIQITRRPAVVTVPADITAEAPAGDDAAQVSYVVTAYDVDGPLVASCMPSSGSFFNAGTTTVNCTAQGMNSSQGFGSFQVTVNVPTLESIAVKTSDGLSSASIAPGDTKQFVATATFSNGETLSTAGDNSGGSGTGGGGSGGGAGSGGGGGPAPSAGFWNVHFTPGLDVSACGGIGGGPGFSSQAFSVDSNGVINNTQWSPTTPRVNVSGQVTANVQVTLTLSCIDNPGITTTATLPWQTTSFDGAITFSGQTTNAHVTGWSSQPSLPTPASASGAATIGNKLYVVGGVANGAPSGLVQVFDLTTRAWLTPAASMSPREGPGVAALNGYIYAAGGRMPGGAATNMLQRFDPVANQWMTLAPMAAPRTQLQLVAANGKLYAIGGDAGNGTPTATVEQYDPVTDQWAARAPMSSARMFFAAGALNNETTIIAAGGSGGSSVELYDIATNSWSATSPLQVSSAAGATIANRFYVATPCGTFVYRPAAGLLNEGWAIMPGMLNPRSQFAVAVSGEVMYAAGGFAPANPSSPLATFDALSTPPPGDLAYNQGGAGGNCSGSGGGGGNGDDDGPTWRIVDPLTHQDSTIASIDNRGLATGLTPGTVLVVAEFGGVSCLDSNECATLTVLDAEPPTITAPMDVTAEATSADGAIVDPGQAVGSDLVGPVTITRSPEGNQFALGTTTITWRATDGAGNFSEATQHVTVVDTTKPVLSLPGDIIVDATSPQGATVTYLVSATDAVSATPVVTCTMASGSVFPIGTTTVTCDATDAAGNTTTGDFTVLVQAAAAQVSQLMVTVQAFNLQQGISNSLDAKLTNILNALNGATTGNTAAVCNQLGAFINESTAQSGKKLTVAQADQLIAAAQQIQAVIGCR